MKSRLLDQATCNANHDRFLQRIIENEVVWYLQHPEGVANSVSNDDGETVILLFWSDRAYASRAKSEAFPEYQEDTIKLFDFLYRWLPGMSSDAVLAGTNWTQDLIGREIDPFDLRTEIEAKMPQKMHASYEAIYLELTNNQKVSEA